MRTATPAQARLRSWTVVGLAEAGILLLALVALGVLFVPAHWTSIWMDREFTGWVAPIANRLVDGQRLYADGMHSPMPPLTFVFLRLISGGNATWLTESVTNYVSQAVTLLVSWAALRHVFGKRVAFVATICAVPIFLSLPKTIAYDAAVQVWVALAAWIIASLPRRWPLLLGLVSALAIMTKQSTGLALAGGVGVALLVAPAEGRVLGHACRHSFALYLVSLLLAFGSLLLVFTPWAAPGGLVHDVLLTGSEPKGGASVLSHDLARYGRHFGYDVLLCGLAIGVVALLEARFALLRRVAAHGETGLLGGARRADADRTSALAVAAAGVAGIALGSATWASDSARLGDPTFSLATKLLEHFALPVVVVLAIVTAWRNRGRADPAERRAIRAFSLLFVSAVGTSLSVPVFRWTFDNNPLVPFVIACLVVGAIWFGEIFDSRRGRSAALAASAVLVLSTLCWARLGDQVDAARSSTETWPEIAHLNGARLRHHAAGMRRLVRVVRRLSTPHDPVLLLPEDPNVEAWFERPRPRLSSAVVFVDQYWDRYVDADLARLKARPPKVIVIGPGSFWRLWGRQWQARRGAERLIARVERDLLPRRYERLRSVPIRFGGPTTFRAPPHTELMRVWVRR